MLDLRLAALVTWVACCQATNFHPHFIESISNVTIAVGKDAILSCRVENLNGHKVAWLNANTQTILTIHKHVISRNPRISLLHNDHHQWDLHISSVKEEDRGVYMCQINTDPMLSQIGQLEVVVPPDIVEVGGNPDAVVREGSNVSLRCQVRGYPPPQVSWRREDGAPIRIFHSEVQVAKGDYLNITKISRLHMGAYLCIATNGIPPSVSRKLVIKVQFPPMIWVQNQREGVYLNEDATISCYSEAYPESINFWTNESGSMLIPGSKYTMNITSFSYKVYMSLRIRRMKKSDFQTYKCLAKNSLGDTDGHIRLYEIKKRAPALPSVVQEYQSSNMGLDDYEFDIPEQESRLVPYSNLQEKASADPRVPLPVFMKICFAVFLLER